MKGEWRNFAILFPLAFAFLFPTEISISNIGWLALIALLLFGLEVVFFLVPGISFSSLLIAIAAIALGFVPTLVISMLAILPAHFILRKDISMFVPDIMVLVPLVAFTSMYGASMLSAFGWGIYGLSVGLLKWGIAIPVGIGLGRNVTKRLRDFILEPPINYLIFWKLHFLFAFLL